jgi:outer membrane autotransporter protein
LSGEIHADTSGQILQDSRYFREAVLMRLSDADNADLPGGFGSARGGQLTYFRYAEEDNSVPQPLAYASTQEATSPIKLAKSPLAGPDLTLWTQGLGAWGQTQSDGNAATLTRSLGGLFTGFDERFGQVRAGVAAGYLNSSLGLAARNSSADINSAHVGGYAGTSFSALHLRAGAEYVWNGVATDRSIVFPGFAEQAHANYTANEAQVFGEVSYSLNYNTIAFEPFGGLAFVHVGNDGFTETGGAAALSGFSGSNDIGYSTLGTRVSTLVALPNGTTLTPWGSLAWEHTIGAVAPNASLAFAGTSATYSILGAPLARDAALVQVGADLRFLPQASIGLNYSGQLARNADDQSLKGTFTWRF